MKKKNIQIIKNIGKLFVTVILLYIIFSKINIARLLQLIKEIDVLLYFYGFIILIVGQIFIATMRWHYSLSSCLNINKKFTELIKKYWIGMFLGYFMPSSIGWDIYRIRSISNNKNDLYNNTILIFFEKIFAILCTFIVIIVAFPIVKEYSSYSEIIARIDRIYYPLLILFFVVLPLFLINKSHIKNIILKLLEKKTILKLSKINFNIQESGKIFIEKLGSFLKIKYIFNMFLLTFVIRITSGIANYLFFYSLNMHVMLSINIFVASLLVIIFFLPISFGSLGVREGSFIILYGLFGVESEYALTVSFMRLTTLLLIISFGGLLFMIFSKSEDKKI
jgi:uncharacterized protein (TIRG00374 family)